jgi:hypothetical protein
VACPRYIVTKKLAHVWCLPLLFSLARDKGEVLCQPNYSVTKRVAFDSSNRAHKIFQLPVRTDRIPVVTLML